MKTRIVDYVAEEVWRQGHDVTQPDGLLRVSWMLEAWVYAMGWTGSLTATKIINTGKLVEQVKNKKGLRTVSVWIGGRVCPAAKSLPDRLNAFVDVRANSPLEDYRRFEEIHPFVDGNGRTGKILLNYLNGTLEDPVFPPNDFWGHPIRNP